MFLNKIIPVTCKYKSHILIYSKGSTSGACFLDENLKLYPVYITPHNKEIIITNGSTIYQAEFPEYHPGNIYKRFARVIYIGHL